MRRIVITRSHDARSTPAVFRIIQADVEDAPELATLFEQYRRFYGEAPAAAACGEFILRHVTRRSTVFFIARQSESNAMLGFVHLLPSTNTLAMRPVWLLEDLYVAQDARRRGVAEALMLHAEAFARHTGAERLTLATAHDNHAAQALYRRLGYVREEHFRYFHRVLR